MLPTAFLCSLFWSYFGLKRKKSGAISPFGAIAPQLYFVF
jgi:hypothetical protein